MKLKAVTYNICSGRVFTNGPAPDFGKYLIDVNEAASALEKYGADIIALNEVRGEGPGKDYTDQTGTIAARLGCHAFFGPAIRFDGGPYGNALLSRFPILDAQIIPIPDPPVRDEKAYYETRCLIRARLDVPGGLTVFVSHFGLAQSEKRNAVATLLDALKTVDTPVLFMGDLNMEPDDPILSPVFSALRDTADILPERPLTFSTYKPEMKIDYIFASDCLTVLEARALHETASDHRPYMAILEI